MIFFGTDGWRAKLDLEINEESVAVVAQAFADYVKNNAIDNKRIAIAYDGRRKSEDFAILFTKVLSANDIEVILADRITPTPVLSYTVVCRCCFAGVMLTASHNPPVYNGIKFKAAYGGPFSLEQTREVEGLLYKTKPVIDEHQPRKYNLLGDYVKHVEQLIDFESIRKANLQIVIDSMGGAGGLIIEDILRKHDILAKTIYGEAKDDFYGRLPEPIADNLKPLSDVLKEDKYAMGVATDGDADRLGVCLDTGDFLSAQTTILLLVDYLKRVRHLSGAIVHTSSVTGLLRKHFLDKETPVYDVQVGFKYITDIMVREDVCFGGEESGGFGYGIHIPERDGIFSALLFLEMLSVQGYKKLSEYVKDREKELGKVCYSRIDAHCEREDRSELLPRLVERNLSFVGLYKVDNVQTFLSSRGVVNGIKYVFEGDCRWLLIRASETENIVRYYAEGQTDEEVKELLSLGQSVVNNL